MLQHQQTLEIATNGQGFTDLSARVAAIVAASGVSTGLCVVFVRHTSASLVIQENADPAVLADLQRFAASLAPESNAWEHTEEGPDDMPAHVRCAVTRT